MKKSLALLLLTSLLSLVPATAMGEEPPRPEQPDKSIDASAPEKKGFLEFGLNLRTDLGVHPLRVDVGFRLPKLEVLLIADPMFVFDKQSSTDLIFFFTPKKVHPYAGWRMTTIGLVDGRQFQQNLLMGVGLALPEFLDGRLRGQWGFELAMATVKHGGGLPSETLSFGSARSYLDLVNFAMFARYDFQLGVF